MNATNIQNNIEHFVETNDLQVVIGATCILKDIASYTNPHSDYTVLTLVTPIEVYLSKDKAGWEYTVFDEERKVKIERVILGDYDIRLNKDIELYQLGRKDLQAVLLEIWRPYQEKIDKRIKAKQRRIDGLSQEAMAYFQK